MTFISGLTQWLMLGVLIHAFVIFAEIVYIQKHGPARNVPSNTDGPPKPLKVFINILFWPVILFVWMQAAWKGQSLIQHLADKEQERKQAARKRLADFKARLDESKKIWTLHGVDGQDGGLHILHFGGADFRPSHLILRMPVGYLTLRLMKHRDPLPLSFDPALADAKAQVEKDTDWLTLCVPGAETDQIRYYRKTASKLNEDSPD